ncbi:MAG: TIGR04141 family sporadically distributed protein [Thermoanaerobaculia bacterium]|nr:TIGR04141 family sporadically distributed protein [Thermoanaerobaculia bacterium]
MPALPISVYRLRGSSTDLQDYLSRPSRLRAAEGSDTLPGAEFWYPEISEKVPPWWSAIQEHFDDIPDYENKSPRGVLLLSRGEHNYAVPFGPQGHTLVLPNRIYRGWGRRIALNLLYDQRSHDLLEGGKLLRGERSKDLTRGITSDAMSSAAITHEEFGFNPGRQILRGVQVRVNRDKWGPNISGGDALKLSWRGSLSQLPELCERLEDDFSRTDYKKHFEFIDNFELVHDSKERQRVWSQAVRAIRSGSIAELGLSPPGPEDLSQLSFSILGVSGHSARGGHVLGDLDLGDYRSLLASLDRLTRLDLDEFNKHRLRMIDSDDEIKLEVRLRDWLDGVVVVGDDSFALSEGSVFRISDRFVDSLDEKISSIDATAAESLSLISFSEAPARSYGDGQRIDERAYNTAIGAPAGRLMMDARNVITIPRRTTAIEFCDVLTADGKLLHVKKGKGSGSISYVCGQATVSSELLCSSRDFRKQARRKIRSAARQDRKNPDPLLQVVPLRFPRRPDQTVILVIVEKSWFGPDGSVLDPRRVLPLFAKIEVCRTLDRLTELGFALQIARVND